MTKRAMGWTGLGLIVLALLVLAGARVQQAATRTRLLSEWADRVPDHPALVRLASAMARPVFQAQCATCHGADATGNRALGAPDLTDADWLYGSGRVSEIEQTLLYGIRSGHHRAHNLADMPGFGNVKPYWRYALPTLTGSQISDVTQYLLSLQRPAVTHDLAAAVRGQALYNGDAQCYDCHTSDARGDTYIGAANLTDRVWMYGNGSAASVAESIAGGRAGVCPAWVGRLPAVVIRALAVYVHAISHGGGSHGGGAHAGAIAHAGVSHGGAV